MQNKTKRFLAVMLSLAMLIGLFPTAFAELNENGHDLSSDFLAAGTTEDTLPTLEFKLLNSDGDAITTTDALTKVDGNYPEVYVVLMAKNFDHFANNAVRAGIYSLVFYIEYDSNYIDIDGGFGIPGSSDMLTYMSDVNVKTSIWNRFNQTIDGTNVRINAYSLGTGDTDKGSGKHLVDMKVMATGDTPTNSFPWANEECVFCVPIQITAEPDTPTQIFSINTASTSPYPVQMAFQTASGLTSGSYGAESHLNHALKVDNSAVNFFPAGATNIGIKTDVEGTVTDTGNNVTITEDNTTKKFSEIKSLLGTNPTKAGFTFAGWSLTSGGTVLKDTDNVTFNLADATAGKTFYAVFTKDKVNYQASDFTVSGNTATYSGSAVTAPTVAGAAGKTVGAISNIKVGTTAANASTTMPTNAGTYKIFVDVAGTDDYNAATALEVGTYTVNKKDATITLTAPTSPTYGETDAGKVNVAVTGAADLAAMGKVVKYAKKGTTAYSETVPTAAGEYTATISNSNATLANNFNVTGTQTLDFTIAAKAVTVNLTATTVTYGDTVTITPTFNVTPAPAHKVEYKVNGSYTTTAPKNAGSYDVKVTITDTNYSGSKEVTNGLVINKKALTIPNTITIPAAKEGATGADLVKNATYTFTAADGIVGSDVVTVAYTVTYTAPVVKDTTPDVALTKGDVTGAAKDNYEVGAMPTGVKGSVTNLSSATWKDTVAPTKTVKASDTTVNDKTYIETGVLADTTFLPATAKVMVDGAEKSVTLTWEVKDVTYNAKGGTYTYEATVTESAEFDVSGLAKPTATITVEAVNITPVTVQPISAKLGDTAPSLPTSGTTTGDVAVPYRIDWVDGSGNPVTELKTDAVLTATYTGTVTYDLTGKEWATEPTDKSVTLSYTVSDKDKTVINSVDDNADVNVKASDEKNTAEDIASLLPATVKAKDAAGNDVELAVTWATTDTFNAKGGEYTYTATFTDEVLADYDVSAITEPVTVKIVVAPVTVKFNKTFKDLSVKKGADNTSFETLGVAAGALSGTIKADDGTDVPYTISWSPDSTELDTSKSGNKQEFTGIVTLTAPDWMTVETIEPVKMTIKVRTSGGGGGGTAAYTVTFSAGKNGTMEGKSSVSVNAGSKVAATAVPEIKAMDGYKFVGWSIDGETTVDPTSATVSKAVKYTALYEEVTAPTPTPTQKPSIDTKYTKPYASGYEDGTFRPNNNITRCELAAMIARLINGDDIADGSYISSFPDVAADAWANKYIGFLEDKGILSGYEDGTFRPYNTITRGEMCAVIARAQKYDIISVDDMFTDVTDADWAKDYITTLASMNIVSGYDGTLFGTYSPLTRAETVAIINRVLDPSTAIVTFTPNDIAGHWAEADIILAVNERQVNGSEPEVTPEPETTPEPEATKAPEATDDPEATKAPEATETPEA